MNARLPDIEVRIWPEIGNASDVEFALVWKPPGGLLASLPNLRAIFSLGAGVDHVFKDPHRPTSVPITRVVDDHLTGGMVEFALLHTLRFHRDLHVYEAQQGDRVFRGHTQIIPEERRVGLLGLGVIGQAVAAGLLQHRFAVAGWSRTPKEIPGVACFHGADGLAPFLAETSILICLLPLTQETAGILNAETFAKLPRGAFVVNLARGDHLIEPDLLAALDSGHIAAAALDVFETEPLPDDHPFWAHPNIRITPHIASISDPRIVADQVAENVRRLRAGKPLLYKVDPAAGY